MRFDSRNACIARRPVYMVNLNTAGGDTGLISAFNRIEAGAFVVIEDIDTARVSRTRSDDAPPPIVDMKPEETVTLGGLLNAIDGLASRDNRVLIVTTNHAETLDPALLRPGRIDHRETIGLIEEREAAAMTEAFLGPATADWFQEQILPHLPMSPAELQGRLLAEADGTKRADARARTKEDACIAM